MAFLPLILFARTGMEMEMEMHHSEHAEVGLYCFFGAVVVYIGL